MILANSHLQWSLVGHLAMSMRLGSPAGTGRTQRGLDNPSLDVFAAAVAAVAAGPARSQIPADLAPGALLQDLLGRGQLTAASHLAAIAITAWASILGYLITEIFGCLHQLITDPGRHWDAHLRTVMLGMGFAPTLTGALEDQPTGA